MFSRYCQGEVEKRANMPVEPEMIPTFKNS